MRIPDQFSKTESTQRQGTMATEDIDRNQFMLDVTKTDFLKEQFAVSRARGSSTMIKNAAGHPHVREEDGMRERTSLRPSSANARQLTNEVRIAALSKTRALVLLF